MEYEKGQTRKKQAKEEGGRRARGNHVQEVGLGNAEAKRCQRRKRVEEKDEALTDAGEADGRWTIDEGWCRASRLLVDILYSITGAVDAAMRTRTRPRKRNGTRLRAHTRTV